jgi:predicted Zn-dependent peptidase
LHKAKEQLMGQLAMAEENNLSFMLMMGKSLLDLGKIEQLDDLFDKIKSIDSNQIMELSREMFDRKNLSTLCYLPN